MKVWESIFNSYSEGGLFLSPFASQGSRHNVENFVYALNPTPEQKERFDQLLSEFCADVESRGFRAGFKIALRLYSE